MSWTHVDEYEHNGKTMVPGTEFSVHGERGARFRFLHAAVVNGKVAWIDAIGGQHKVRMWRSFRPEQINRITLLKPKAKVAA